MKTLISVLRQHQTGEQTRRLFCERNFRFDIVPASQQFTPEFFIHARALYLIQNKLVIIFNRFDDLSQLAHFFDHLPVIPSGVEESLFNFSQRRSRDVSTSLDMTS